MKKKFKWFLVILLLILVFSFSVYAEPEYTFKAGHDQAISMPYQYLMEVFADKVEEKTEGQVRIEIYPQAQLGEELELAEGLRIGTIDFMAGSIGNLTPLIPEGGLLGVPYIVENKEHQEKLGDPNGQFYKALYTTIEEKNIGMKLLGLVTCGTRSAFNNVRPIYTPDDLDGLKIRVMTSDIQMKSWDVLGSSPTTVNYDELYSALQHKVVDGAENAPWSTYAMKHHEVSKYFSLTEHMISFGLFLMSEKTYNMLPTDLRSLVIEAANEAVEEEKIFDGQLDEAGVQKLLENGVKVNLVYKQPFIKLVEPIQEEVAQKYNCTNLLEIIKEEAK
jgi:tripartite ATP-independent transporter DctP family solute receptor